MIIATAMNAYLLFFKQPPSRSEFLRRVRARPDTYAAELMGDLYDEVFRNCVELRREYQRYYALEYPRFSDFTANFRYFPEKLQPKADAYFARYKVIIPFGSHGWIYQDEEGLRLLAKVFRLTPKSL
jgi:hypothetical protein